MTSKAEHSPDKENAGRRFLGVESWTVAVDDGRRDRRVGGLLGARKWKGHERVLKIHHEHDRREMQRRGPERGG